MADDNQPVEIPDSKVHTDADFMSAIDAHMEAYDEKAVKNEVRPQLEKPKSDEPGPEKDAALEDGGEKIEVKTKVSKAEEIVAESPPEQAEEGGDKETLSHEGKALKPITIKAAQPAPEQETQAPPVAQAVAQEQVVEVRQRPSEPAKAEIEEPAKEVGAEVEPAKKDDTDSEENKKTNEKADIPQKPKDNKPQPLKVFDTVQYHLPIKPTRHHRKHTVNPLTTTFLLSVSVVLITVAAIDMEVLNIGINLPFDLL